MSRLVITAYICHINNFPLDFCLKQEFRKHIRRKACVKQPFWRALGGGFVK